VRPIPAEETHEPGSRARGAENENDELGRFMKEPAFDATPEFQHFKDVMRRVLKVPKARLDELVHEAQRESPRRNNPHSPGRKRRITASPKKKR
jgi:hypothetical protein